MNDDDGNDDDKLNDGFTTGDRAPGVRDGVTLETPVRQHALVSGHRVRAQRPSGIGGQGQVQQERGCVQGASHTAKTQRRVSQLSCLIQRKRTATRETIWLHFSQNALNTARCTPSPQKETTM